MLCATGQKLYNNYITVSNSFSVDISRAETYEQRDKVIKLFSQAFEGYHDHVAHCLECSIDKREIR